MASITGTGCQLSALTAAFVTASPDCPLEAAAAASQIACKVSLDICSTSVLVLVGNTAPRPR